MTHSAEPIQRITAELQRARRELLDLSTRNRLLSIPQSTRAARVIQVHDERSVEVLRLLVGEKRSLAFLPAPEAKRARTEGVRIEPVDGVGSSGAAGTAGTTGAAGESGAATGPERAALPQPEDGPATGGPAARHLDLRLQTALGSEMLQRRLLDMHDDATTFFEEQGVNILYLALGALEWFDLNTPETPRLAPLVLIPVTLARRSVSQRFQMSWTEDDPAENISLVEKLSIDHRLQLPEFKSGEDLDLAAYIASIRSAVESEPRWKVHDDHIVLGFFSFAKFLMWRDLDPASWPADKAIDRHDLVGGLLGDGFPVDDAMVGSDADVDTVVSVAEMRHVVDADGSQALAIEAVRSGANLVIQGPPGTGKSQTITNVIAAAVSDGRKVLFVAEKMAALDVVKRRLDNIALGPLCLELHSNRATKRHVLEALRSAWDLGRPLLVEAARTIEELGESRAELNAHAALMHTATGPAGFTPFRIIGELVGLETAPLPPGRELLAEPERWTLAEFEARSALVADLAERVGSIGQPDAHPWRGVRRDAMLRPEIERVAVAARELLGRLEATRAAAAPLAEAMGIAAAETLANAQAYAVAARHLIAAPPLDRAAIADPAWTHALAQISALVSAGERLPGLARKLAEAGLAEAGWTADVAAIRRVIEARGRSWTRVFSGEYRQAMSALRGLLTNAPPAAVDERIALLDRLIEAQGVVRGLQADEAIGVAAFGALWQGPHTDWAAARAVVEWVEQIPALGLPDAVRALAARALDAGKVGAVATAVDQAVAATVGSLVDLGSALALDWQAQFGSPDPRTVPTGRLTDGVNAWLADPEALARWTAYHGIVRAARASGLGGLAAGLESGEITHDAAPMIFRRAYFERLLTSAAAADARLASFNGEAHAQKIERFRALDRRRIELARAEAALAHFQGLPSGATGVGQVGVLKGELARKRGHLPIRKLFRSAGQAIQAIKPVFMMSPLSVAQFLEPGALDFDLLVVDEASQVEPVDALGAIARSRQIVVVGDDRQLPPTRFFQRMTTEVPAGEAEADEDDDGRARVGDVESVLSLCLAKGIPDRMLRWHYRSRHHSLIAVSNAEFYQNRLFVVPSPQAGSGAMGLSFTHVPDGVFDSGGSAVNVIEAKAVALAIMRHARESPELTLGVATFSVRQRQAIRDELEALRRATPEYEPFFEGHPEEPFFIKNLENVQGDERDTILISVGYGRNAQGYLAMRFGPLSAEGGERRLNVLISRARLRCEVFASITADDIDTERAGGRGVAALKTFLAFAQSGRIGIAQASGREFDSPFEVAVAQALEAAGHVVHPQVGIAGFFIDLAVVDPQTPGRYLLGIECDGVAYHASRSARDRDRLREAVLRDHGWRLHRIWGIDWYARPKEQLARLLAAVDEARSAVKAADDDASRRALERAREQRAPPPAPSVERDESTRALGSAASASPAYEEFRFSAPADREPHELAVREMADLVVRLVEVEGPVHADEVVVRIRDNWGLSRAGSRIQQSVTSALAHAVASKRLVATDGFHDIAGRLARVRDRSAVASAGLRKPELLPTAEIGEALRALVRSGLGVRLDELPPAVARALGFKVVSPGLRSRIDGVAAVMVALGELVCEGDIVRVAAEGEA